MHYLWVTTKYRDLYCCHLTGYHVCKTVKNIKSSQCRLRELFRKSPSIARYVEGWGGGWVQGSGLYAFVHTNAEVRSYYRSDN